MRRFSVSKPEGCFVPVDVCFRRGLAGLAEDVFTGEAAVGECPKQGDITQLENEVGPEGSELDGLAEHVSKVQPVVGE